MDQEVSAYKNYQGLIDSKERGGVQLTAVLVMAKMLSDYHVAIRSGMAKIYID